MSAPIPILSASGGMTFSCPMCGEIIVTPPYIIAPDGRTAINPTPILQLRFSALYLHRHLVERHRRTQDNFVHLIEQYSMALIVKVFESSDPVAIETRELLYKACIDTLIQEWTLTAQAPESQNAPAGAVPVIR